MTGLADYRVALEMREIIRGLVKEEVERARPRYQLATVQGFDRINRKCTVRFNGETSDVDVNMGSIQPSAIGQIVRIDGLLGDRYVAEVLGTAYQPLEERVSALESDPSAAAVFNANPGFELGLSGWSNFWATGGANAILETNSPNAYSGANCVYVPIDLLGDTGLIQSGPYPVQPGEPIFVSYAAKWDGNGVQPKTDLEAVMAPDEPNANYFGTGSSIITPLGSQVIGTTYELRQAVMIVPAGVNYARFAVRVDSQGDGVAKVWIDHIRLQRLVFPDFSLPTTFGGAVTHNGAVTLNGVNTVTDEITLPAITSTTGLTGTGGKHLAAYRRMDGVTFKSGGLRFVESNSVGWVDRIIYMGMGRSTDTLTGGYLELQMPADTTVITRYGISGGGTNTVTVASGRIPLTGWEALYYEVNTPKSAARDDSKWRIVDYNSNFEVPPNWILVCTRNNDATSVIWGDGREQDYWHAPTLGNSWVNYSGSFEAAAYTKINGIVYLKGLIKSGTVSTTATGDAFYLPAKYRPAKAAIFSAISSASTPSAIYIYDATSGSGAVRITSGNNGWVSLNGINFVADS